MRSKRREKLLPLLVGVEKERGKESGSGSKGGGVWRASWYGGVQVGFRHRRGGWSGHGDRWQVGHLVALWPLAAGLVNTSNYLFNKLLLEKGQARPNNGWETGRSLCFVVKQVITSSVISNALN